MFITTEIRQTVDETRAALADPKPLQALAGAGDLLVERLRTAAAAQHKAIQGVRFDPSAVPPFMSATLDDVRGAITGLPARAQHVVVDTIVRANSTYDGLATRGAGLIRRINRQRASQDLIDQLANTLRSAKAARTMASKASAATGSRMKATATSARNVASAAGAAVTAAASKTGTIGSAAPTRTPKAGTTRKPSKTVPVSSTRTASSTGKSSPTAKKASVSAKKTSASPTA